MSTHAIHHLRAQQWPARVRVRPRHRQFRHRLARRWRLGPGAEPAEARKIFDRFAEAGGTLVDTAENYQAGESEQLLGEFLGADRDHFALTGKYSMNGAGPQTVSNTGNSRRYMVQALDASLRRLNTDHLDMYWVHAPDGLTPMEEILRGLDDLVSAGKIRYFGLSNFPAWRVSRAAAIAELGGWSPVAGIQVEYSLVNRTAERELLPMAQALGLGAALWSPLGGGLLTGKYRQGATGRISDLKAVGYFEDTAQKTAIVGAVLDVAAELGVSASHVPAPRQHPPALHRRPHRKPRHSLDTGMAREAPWAAWPC